MHDGKNNILMSLTLEDDAKFSDTQRKTRGTTYNVYVSPPTTRLEVVRDISLEDNGHNITHPVTPEHDMLFKTSRR